MWFQELVHAIFGHLHVWWQIAIVLVVFIAGISWLIFLISKFIISKIKVKEIKVGNISVSLDDKTNPPPAKVSENIKEEIKEAVHEAIEEEKNKPGNS
jgi:hypothetical protein